MRRTLEHMCSTPGGLSHIAQKVHPNLVDHDALGACVAHVNRAGNAANQIARVGVLAADDSLDFQREIVKVQTKWSMHKKVPI